ncbi:MAG: hypothetical protein Q8K55_11690 [Gemmatimonadaceae bacterium]|nr:hypothetical protein [Gemmatimonadaceae bacterium]
MRRTLMVSLLLVAAGATRVLGAQAPTSGLAPGSALDPWVGQALREQLSAGYDPRRVPSGVLQRLSPDRPLVRQVPVVPESIPSLAQSADARRCPMPVVKSDVRSFAPMPVARADSTRLEKMPVARPACVNPLEPK